jgi:hypothetical protein
MESSLFSNTYLLIFGGIVLLLLLYFWNKANANRNRKRNRRSFRKNYYDRKKEIEKEKE